jgi:cyclopropane-fatty-acyl-phospholipid synthase
VRARPPRPVRISDERALLRVLLRGELGAGEAYVAGEWDADDLVAALRAFLRSSSARGIESPLTQLVRLPDILRHRLAGTRDRARRDVAAHYDLGNAFYALWLDPAMVYSCAIWEPGDDLARAQQRKLDRLCDLAQVAPGDRVLEIGCGWGALALAAARRGAHVTALTLSREQASWTRRAAADAGLADRIDVQLRDWRTEHGAYDRVLSVEMLEAVGPRELPRFFSALRARLRRGGRAVLQTITIPDARWPAYRRGVDWMQTYVFPGTTIPCPRTIHAAASRADLRITHEDEIGPSYAPTLAAWRARFHAALPAVKALGFDDRFLRTWDLYLAFSEAAFTERTLGDAQLVLT